MAKIEQLEPRISLREQLAGASEGAWRRSIMPSICWGSVIAGVAVALSVQLVLTLFGLATGLATLDAAESGNFGLASTVWAGISMLAVAFVGGFVAGRMSGLRRKTDGVLHGAVAWAVATLLLAALAGYAGGTLLGAAFSGMDRGSMREAGRGDYELTVVLRGLIGGDVSVADVQTVERYIRSGQREEAILLLSAIGMDPVQAAALVDQAMAAVLSQPKAQSMPMSASGAVKSSDTVAWLVFGGIFLSLLSGMGGGLVGALGSRRLVWSKQTARGG